MLKFHDSNSEELVAFNNELEAVIAAIETDGEDIQDCRYFKGSGNTFMGSNSVTNSQSCFPYQYGSFLQGTEILPRETT